MPNVSKTTCTRSDDLGPGVEHSDDLADMTVNFLELNETVDLTEALAGLPDGLCQCPHWGYLFKGSAQVRYADHTESYQAGDAFYMTPGHCPTFDAGSEFVMFSPSDELKATDEAIVAYFQAQAAANA